jgi:hypothetical protein
MVSVRRRIVLLGVAAGMLSTACAGTPASSSAGACADLQTPGVFPELERLVPRSVGDTAVTRLESGRSCSDQALGSLAGAGIHELRFAGAVVRFSLDDSTGVTVSVYRAPGLTIDLLADVFANGAGTSRSVSGVHAARSVIGGRAGVRIDAIAAGQDETVFVWPSAEPETFDAVIAIGAREGEIVTAVQAFAPGLPAPSAGTPAPGASG